jgi:hypothetical protein
VDAENLNQPEGSNPRESSNPLDELKSLNEQVDAAADLATLKPIFYRLEEIAKEHPGNFEVQLALGDLRQRLVTRGNQLRRQEPRPAPPPVPVPITARPIPSPEPVEASEQSPRPPDQSPNPNWKRALLLGALAGSVVSLVIIAFLVNQARKRNLSAAPPPGNSVQQVTVATTTEPAAIPQSMTLRILTDLDQGKASFDEQAPVDLQEGQFVLEKVQPGRHTVKITGRNNNEASFAFEAALGNPPAIDGPVTTRNLIGIVVASQGSNARVVTSSGPLKLVVNGVPEDNAGPAGVDVKSFLPGVDEIVVGEGKDQRSIKETFGPTPMLTAFFKSDVNAGTLIVSTGEDDARVWVNDKEYRRRTQKGQVRIPTIGPVKVRVAKDGFQDEPVQTAEVKKGAEVRLEFKLKPVPQVATLQIRGATAGADVLLDQKQIGTVGPDGSFTYPTVPAGDRTIEISRDKFVPKRLQRSFKTGQTILISGGDALLAAANGTVRLARAPLAATVTYRRADETESHEAKDAQLELPAGNYIFSGKAPGYTDRTERVQVTPGETRNVELALTREVRVAPPPPPAPVVVTGLNDFEGYPSGWRNEGDIMVHKGGNVIPYNGGSKGVFNFTVELRKGGSLFRGGRIRWVAQYRDSKNYLLYEMDNKNFWAEVVENGKKLERVKTQHNLDQQKAYTIQVELSPDRLIHKIQNGSNWMTVDDFSEPGRNFTQGKFGFLIQGGDELGVVDFKFQPR